MPTDARSVAVVFLACLVFSWINVIIVPSPVLTDYATYWAQAKFSEEFPAVDIFDPANQDRVKEHALKVLPQVPPEQEERFIFSITQTPFFTSVISSVLTGDFFFDRKAFQTVDMAAGFFALAILLGALAYSKRMSLLAFLWLPVFYVPFKSDVANNNFNSLLLALLVFPLWLASGARSKGRLVSGFILGIALMLKPTVMFPLAALCFSRLVRREFEWVKLELPGFLAGIALSLALSAYHFGGIGIWFSWASRISSLTFELSPLTSWNLSLPSAVWTYFQMDISTYTSFFFLALTLCALWVQARLLRASGHSRPSGLTTDMQALGLGGLAFLLGSPLAWMHYFMLALPTALILGSRTSGKICPEGKRAALFRTLLVLAICGISMGPVGLFFPTLPMFDIFLVVWGGAFILWVLGTLDLFQPAQPKDI